MVKVKEKNFLQAFKTYFSGTETKYISLQISF